MKFPLRLPSLLAFIVGLVPILVLLGNYKGCFSDDFEEDVVNNDLHKSKELLIKEAYNKWKEWNIPSDSSKVVTRGEHRYTQFTVEPFLPRGKTTVCLATQTTLNWLHHIVEVAGNWKGRMSVALYVPGLEFTRTKIVLWLLNQCSRQSSMDITFTFVFPLSNPADDDPEMWSNITFTRCRDFSSLYNVLKVRNEFFDYPQNLMRNIAKDGCGTPFSILADNDMIPSPNLARDLEPVLRDQMSCDKCAFVIPIYEIAKRVKRLPEDKQQLLKLIKRNLAQPFHWKAWVHNQGSHKPKKWQRLPPAKSLHVAYPVYEYQLYYEPVYVAKKNVTPFDERFLGYGFTRNSQVFQMITEGYRFFVLDPAFFMHRGFKRPDSNPKWRDSENYRNFDIFVEFAKDHLRKRGYAEEILQIIDQQETGRKKREVLSDIVRTIDNFSYKKKTKKKA